MRLRSLRSKLLLLGLTGGLLSVSSTATSAQAPDDKAAAPAQSEPEPGPAANEDQVSSAQAVDWDAKTKALQAFVQGKAGPSMHVEEIFSLGREEVEALLALPSTLSLKSRVASEKARLARETKKEERALRRRYGSRVAAQRLQERWQKAPFLPIPEPVELKDPPPAEQQAAALARYVEAASLYLALPQGRQDAMWRDYAQRPSDQRPDFSARTTALSSEAAKAALEGLLEGKADPELELQPCLAIDLRRDGRWLWDGSYKGDGPAYRFYTTAPESRAKLFSDYQQAREQLLRAQQEAQEAKAKEKADAERKADQARKALEAASELERQRAEALRAAKEAESAAARLAATERARLLSIRAQQESWSAKINAWRQESEELHDETMTLVQSVAEYDHKEMPSSMARNYYEQVDSVLGRARRRLKERMSESLAGSTSVAQDIEQIGPLPPLTVEKEAVEQLRFELLKRANELQEEDREVAWQRMTTRHEDLMALNRSRLSILSKLPSSDYSKYAGVSVSGWRTVLDEFDQMKLELQVRWLGLRRRFDKLTQELAEKASSILWALVQLTLILLVFRWWRKKGQEILIEARLNFLDKRREYPIMGKVAVVFWYLIKIRSPLEWWIFGWLVAQIWLSDEWVEVAILWTIYKWIVGGLLAVSLLNAIAVQGMRRSRGQKDKTRQLRTDTLRLICYTGTAMGLILAVTEQLAGRGAFYGWVSDGAWIVYIPMAIYLLIRWKPTVYERCERLASKGPIPRWVVEQNSVRKSFLGTTVGAVYLMYQGAVRRVSRLLMGLESVRKAAAFLLRREVMSNAQEQEGGAEYRPHALAASPHFDPDAPASEVLAIGPSSRIEGLISSLDEGRTALVAVVGGRGAGKSSFLYRLVTDSDERIYDHVIDCPAEGLSSLFRALEEQVGASLQDRSGFEAALDAKGAKVLCVDNLHRLIRPTIGGLAELDDFIAFARGWSQRLSWVVAMEGSAWRYTKRARGNRVFFDEVIQLKTWTEEEIVALLDSRNESAGVEPDFSTLNLSRPEDEFEDDLDPVETQVFEEMNSNRRKYYRVLWEYSGGNPGVALHAWSRSLYQPCTGDVESCVARVFPNPELARIEKLSLPALFTLRAIVQLEMATEAQIVECTNLAEQDCADAVRVIIAGGYVYRDGPWLRIHWDWQRAIATVLVRQHLLAAS